MRRPIYSKLLSEMCDLILWIAIVLLLCDERLISVLLSIKLNGDLMKFFYLTLLLLCSQAMLAMEREQPSSIETFGIIDGYDGDDYAKLDEAIITLFGPPSSKEQLYLGELLCSLQDRMIRIKIKGLVFDRADSKRKGPIGEYSCALAAALRITKAVIAWEKSNGVYEQVLRGDLGFFSVDR